MLVRVQAPPWLFDSLSPNPVSDASEGFSFSPTLHISPLVILIGGSSFMPRDAAVAVFSFSSLTWSTVTGFSTKHSATKLRNF